MSDVPTSAAISPQRRSRRLLTWLSGALARRAEDASMQRSLKRLAEYDDHLLDDIGMTREQALRCAPWSTWKSLEWWTTTCPR